MHLYYRVCEKEQSISYVNRYQNFSKKTILRLSWASLKDQITENDKVIFIYDEVCQETLNWLDNSFTIGLRDFVRVPKHDWNDHLHNEVLFSTLESHLDNKGLHFIVEDDYLYKENALSTIETLDKIYEGFFVPQDYPDRYRTTNSCQVVLGLTCHWRTIDSSTWNMGGTVSAWKKHIQKFKDAALTSNDKILEDIYKVTPCISPIPGIATHLTEHHPTPFFPITKRLEELKID